MNRYIGKHEHACTHKSMRRHTGKHEHVCTHMHMHRYTGKHEHMYTHVHAQTHSTFFLVTVIDKLLTERSLLKQVHVQPMIEDELQKLSPFACRFCSFHMLLWLQGSLLDLAQYSQWCMWTIPWKLPIKFLLSRFSYIFLCWLWFLNMELSDKYPYLKTTIAHTAWHTTCDIQ